MNADVNSTIDLHGQEDEGHGHRGADLGAHRRANCRRSCTADSGTNHRSGEGPPSTSNHGGHAGGVSEERIPEHTVEEIIDVPPQLMERMTELVNHTTRCSVEQIVVMPQTQTPSVEVSKVPSRARATVAQMRREMKVTNTKSKNTFAKMGKGFGKIGSEPGEEAVIMSTSKELRDRNLERDVPSDLQDVVPSSRAKSRERRTLEALSRLRYPSNPASFL